LILPCLQKITLPVCPESWQISGVMPEQPTKANRPEKAEGECSPNTDGKGAAPQELTPEEQMALYEKELKENDWGHQPC
jgi:hypothetical protein